VGAGSDHPAARNRSIANDLSTIAAANRWESAPASTVGVARALDFVLDSANLLWAAPNSFVPTDLLTIRAALAA